MTVMEPNSKQTSSTIMNDNINNINNNSSNNSFAIDSSYAASNYNSTADDRHNAAVGVGGAGGYIINNVNIQSRKNSTTGSINLNHSIINNHHSSASNANNYPASTLSLSSNSSNSSTVNNNMPNSATANRKFKLNSNNSSENVTPPQTSRRQSGNSVTIRITNENNIENSYDYSNNDLQLSNNKNNVFDDDIDQDRDDAEDTTSNSTSNDYSNQQRSKKKLKDRKKFVRSSAQQQHHLLYQESEDQVDEMSPQSNNYHHNSNDLDDLDTIMNENSMPAQNMNSAFDELFAAAESGNSSMSAAVEAKIAAATAAATAAANGEDETGLDFSLRKRNSTMRSRNNSVRKANGSVKRLPRSPMASGTIENDNIAETSFSNTAAAPPSAPAINHQTIDALKVEGYLGSPQPLTRSCSCKRPGSFKKMRAKNASPNRATNSSNQSNGATNATNENFIVNVVPAAAASNVTGRRGTQCSVSISEDLEANKQNRAGSLPFDTLNNMLQQNAFLNAENSEFYRVRQFNMTDKGSVINRGDSFKRSFKRSNQSLSNKKDASPTALPQIINIFEPNQADETLITPQNDAESELMNPNLLSVPQSVSTAPVDTYIVYMVGATNVGKNAMIKQFKTSEYSGTYNICIHQSTEEDPEELVSIMLDGIESRLQFIAMDIDSIKPGTNSMLELARDNDAFIVVYSISDKASYNVAIDLLKSIRVGEFRYQPVILVGNKSDLVRKRAVDRDDACNLAIKYACKFVETSVAINDKVDDLLAGILKQIRIKKGVDFGKKSDVVSEPISDLNPNSSEIQLQDLIIQDRNLDRTSINNMSFFKRNTLRIFRSQRDPTPANRSATGHQATNKKVNRKTSSNNQQSLSFLQKLFNNIFKKKSFLSHVKSVENLSSPPAIYKSKK